MQKDIGKTKLLGIISQRAMPENTMPMGNFNLNPYLGKWYEICRLDYYWEPAFLDNVSAEYSLTDKKGVVRVLNSGYNNKKEKWQTYRGKARFRADEHTGALEVSFWGPIWAGYNVMAVDEDYRYALVFGRNNDYLWFLSRTKDIPPSIQEKYKGLSRAAGYDLSRLRVVRQDKN